MIFKEKVQPVEEPDVSACGYKRVISLKKPKKDKRVTQFKKPNRSKRFICHKKSNI